MWRRVVQQVVTQQAIANYVFDAQAIPFLSVATNPPAGLKFLSATLDFPGEQTATNVPTFAVSTTGFLPTASSPVIVRLENQVRMAQGSACMPASLDGISGWQRCFHVALTAANNFRPWYEAALIHICKACRSAQDAPLSQ